jgi:sec-independent protein translocase protein TatA
MLNNIGLPGLLLIAIVVLVLFGRGKISSLMGEVGKGITAFKKGVGEASRDDDEPEAVRMVPPEERMRTVPPQEDRVRAVPPHDERVHPAPEAAAHGENGKA